MALTKTFVPGGHVFVLDSSGPGLKDFELRDYHNTIHCVKCGDYFCDLCYPNVLKEECPEKDETLPGLEYE